MIDQAGATSRGESETTAPRDSKPEARSGAGSRKAPRARAAGLALTRRETVREQKKRRMSTAAAAVAAEAAEMGIDPENLLHFRAARKRTLEERIGMFVKVHKPGVDGHGNRAFSSTAEYRRWCNRNLPKWLGYGTD